MLILSLNLPGGANPTLTQLKENQLIPEALYWVAFSSLFRYTQELFYLIGT